MTITAQPNYRFFDGGLEVDWLANGRIGSPVDVSAGAYAPAGGSPRITVLPLHPTQAVDLSRCGPLPGHRCNVSGGMPLLMADNLTSAPIRLAIAGTSVRAVGAFVVAPGVPFGTPYAAHLWVDTGNGVPTKVPGGQSVTGDIWTKPGDPVAPFVGVSASGGERITAVYFDATHASTQVFARLGIAFLYLLP